MSRFAPILLLALAAACARGVPAGFDTVDSDYATGGGAWNTGGGITVAVRALEKNGRTLVCGAWTTDRQSAMTYPYNADVMAVGSVYLGGERLVQNLSYMSRVRGGSLLGAEARCAASPVSWRPEFAGMEPRVRFPRYVAGGVDSDEGGTGGNALIFRETERPDLGS